MESKMHRGAPKPLFQMARENRDNSTHAEHLLWNYLKTKPYGIKFRRQHPYSIYILDFYCHSRNLVIEVDGNIHDLEEVKKNDLERQKLLEGEGLTVTRFSNDELIYNFGEVIKSLDTVIQKIIDDKKR